MSFWFVIYIMYNLKLCSLNIQQLNSQKRIGQNCFSCCSSYHYCLWIHLFVYEICCPLPVVSHNSITFDNGQTYRRRDLKEKNGCFSRERTCLWEYIINWSHPGRLFLSINIHHLSFFYFNVNSVSGDSSMLLHCTQN